MKTILELKEKSKINDELALGLLQKQLQVLRLKEYLVLIGMVGGAVLMRKLMEPMPSIEPIMFFAILSGWLFGKKKGAFVGATSGFLSNFIMFGGQGLWTIFQVIGWGAAGYLGGFLGKRSKMITVVAVTLLATLVFEISMNISTFLFLPVGLIASFLLAMPFTITHLFSNLVFATAMPSTKRFIEKTGRFNEREICKKLIKKLKHVRSHRI